MFKKFYYRTKNDYLGQAPNINNPGVKSHEKYKKYVEIVNAVHKGEVKK